MKNIDLGPNNYRKRDPRTGKWHLPDDPKLARNYFFVLLVVLGFVFWNRHTLDAGLLFGVASVSAWCAGIMFAVWLKDRY